MKYSLAKKAALLALPLFVATSTASSTTKNLRSTPSSSIHHQNAVEETSASSSGSILKKFLTWHVDALNHSEDTASAYPLWSTRKLSGDETNVLFSFSLSRSTVERYERQKQQRHLQTEEEATGDGLFDTEVAAAANEEEAAEVEEEGAPRRKRGPDPLPPVHLGAHEMVVHVTYEDICKYTMLYFIECIYQIEYTIFRNFSRL